jgi:glycosyltransferase involved in cell wall biosynthesis
LAKIPSNLASDIENLYQEFNALRPEVVHAWLDWSNVRAGMAAALAGVPRILLSGRNLSPRHFLLNTDYYFPAYAALMEKPKARIVLLNNSQAGASDYADWLSLPPGQIRVIRNGTDFPEEARPDAQQRTRFRAERNIPPDAPLIGGMFRFNEEKCPMLWLEAAERIGRALPAAHFALFGEGPLRDQMLDWVRARQAESQFHFCGHVSPSLQGLAPCDIILLASRGEGTPNVLLEAQWLGLPVVTTNAGGAPEAVHNGVTGLVVEGDAGQIAQAAIDVLRSREFREQARVAGPRFVGQRYGMQRMIDETVSAYGLKR